MCSKALIIVYKVLIINRVVVNKKVLPCFCREKFFDTQTRKVELQGFHLTVTLSVYSIMCCSFIIQH